MNDYFLPEKCLIMQYKRKITSTAIPILAFLDVFSMTSQTDIVLITDPQNLDLSQQLLNLNSQ